jgi:mono/diheme cytochrome c family protein
MFSWDKRNKRLPVAAAAAALLLLGAALPSRAASPSDDAADAAEAAALAKIAPIVPAESDRVGHYGYGAVPTAAQIAGWAIDIRPDGQGLPDGSGTVEHGADVYAQQCAGCHGTFGEGEGRYPKLASDSKLTGDQPTKAVGNYWPYATTLWDYINRAMPFPAPHSLSANDVYAITAYVLNLNNIVPDNFVADRNSLPKVVMPNRHGFILRDPRPDTASTECMAHCLPAADVKITSTAEGKDLTPRTSGPLDEMAPK